MEIANDVHLLQHPQNGQAELQISQWRCLQASPSFKEIPLPKIEEHPPLPSCEGLISNPTKVPDENDTKQANSAESADEKDSKPSNHIESGEENDPKQPDSVLAEENAGKEHHEKNVMNINGWEMMIPLGFFVAAGVRVANELGAGNGRGVKFAIIVSTTTSSAIGVLLWVLIVVFRQDFSLLFTSSSIIRDAASRLAILLAFTILLNSVQPVLSGIAVGSGWQSYVAWINIGCYYVIGVPFGVLLGWVFNLGVLGIWTGMICGTAVQTLILAYIIYRCDWEQEAAEARNRLNTWSSEDST